MNNNITKLTKLIAVIMTALVLTACGTSEEEEEVYMDDEPIEEANWDDMKDEDMIIGVSDLDYSDVAGNKPTKVRNDNTGKWRKTLISESEHVEDYALSYYELHMKDEEIHNIINRAYNTTSTLSISNGLLYVDVKECVDEEEHDASTLGSGMLLKSYVIFPDGDIQELE